MSDRRISLRKKILLLALVPVVVSCLGFFLLTLRGAYHVDAVEHQDTYTFMLQRTEKSLVHADRSAAFASDSIANLLRSQVVVAHLLIANRGGIQTGSMVARTLAGDGMHVGGVVQLPGLRIGGENAGMGERLSIIQEMARDMNATILLLQQLPGSGEFVRVAASKPQMQAGTFLQYADDDSNRRAPDATLAAGEPWFGRTQEGGLWHIGRYEPLRDSKGTVVGALYIGFPIDSLLLLQKQIAANTIGSKGSVDLFYAHGAERGKSLLHPTGVAAATRSTWLPKALDAAPRLRGEAMDGLTVREPGGTNEAIVRYSYIPDFDWVIVAIADSDELHSANGASTAEFVHLAWYVAFETVAVLALIAVIASVYSRRIVDPLMEVTIQLTSNGTQVASSARQQLDVATSFNASSTQIATATKEISSTSKELLRAMEDLSREAGHASVAAQEGSTGLQGLSSSIENLSTATTHITDSLNKIRDRATRINAVTLAVTKVADQTNLLSLNAAIEAEKAGEVGAGFGVVAREVRRLADQSARSSQEIGETVLEMQDAVSAGVQQVQILAIAMQNGIAATERINQQFSEIIARVEAMTPRYERVHLGMQNQTEGAQQISEAMSQLTESASATTDAVAELNGVSNELHSAVRVLKQRIFEGDEVAAT